MQNAERGVRDLLNSEFCTLHSALCTQSVSSSDLGQSCLSNRDIARSASNRPAFWQRAQDLMDRWPMSDFVGSEFEDDARAHLLLVHEYC